VSAHPGSEPVALVDGGVFANNPAACALVEAICAFGALPATTLLLSLGTGEHTRPIPYEEARSWGLAHWAQPILDVVFDGVSDTVDYQVASILKGRDGREHYQRIQSPLTRGNDAMDDASEENIEALKRQATVLVRSHAAELDRWAELLTADPSSDPARPPSLPLADGPDGGHGKGIQPTA
jgi:hypothetical protein